ncbi:MAG: hypothetical protein P8179_22330 [Candidatus Thiodiazotropha sp.]
MRSNKPHINEKLHTYCVEFSEFNKRCEKLCNAFANIATHHESISSYSVRGMQQNAKWLKYRINEFKTKLENLCDENR